MIKNFPADYSGLHPYVFKKIAEEPVPVPEIDEIWAPPFELISIEMDTGPVTSSDAGAGAFNIECIVVREVSVDTFEFTYSLKTAKGIVYFLIDTQKVVMKMDGVTREVPGFNETYNSIKAILMSFLGRLRASKAGVFNTPDKAKFKKRTGENAVFKGTDVMYISPKKDTQNSGLNSASPARSVRWLDAWEVGQHWRLISPESLGVDRHGNRCVPGKTFIHSYTKGTGAPLIKTRKVTR